jgi:hypothetical protein
MICSQKHLVEKKGFLLMKEENGDTPPSLDHGGSFEYEFLVIGPSTIFLAPICTFFFGFIQIDFTLNSTY